MPFVKTLLAHFVSDILWERLRLTSNVHDADNSSYFGHGWPNSRNNGNFRPEGPWLVSWPSRLDAFVIAAGMKKALSIGIIIPGEEG